MKNPLPFFKQKIFAVVVITSTLMFLAAPFHSAQAIPVEVAADPFSVAINVEQVAEFGKTVVQWAKESWEKVLTDIVAKRLIDYIVDETIRWIEGGGKPKFVTDWQGFLRDAGNIAFDQVVKDVGASRICEPFAFSVRLSLLPVPTFSQRLECTLDRVVSNINAFYDDFRNGGWAAYNEAWKPQNNYYGQTILIQDEMQRRAAEEWQVRVNEARAGGGFLSSRKCIEPIYEERPVEGGIAQVQVGCRKEEIITPGSVVGKAVGDAVTSDIQWAANLRAPIQAWVAALTNAVINRVLKEAVGGLRGAAQRLPDVQIGENTYRPPELQGAINSQFEYDKQLLLTPIQLFIAPIQDFLDIKTRSRTSVSTVLTNLQNLQRRNCEPAVTQNELEETRTTLNTLNTQISQTEPALTDLRNLRDRILQTTNQVDLAHRNVDRENLFARYRLNDPEIERNILSGALRADAELENSRIQSKLGETANRIQACVFGTRPQTGGQ